MREQLKNELMMLLDKNVDMDMLRKLEPQIEIILSNYEVEQRKTEMNQEQSGETGMIMSA